MNVLIRIDEKTSNPIMVVNLVDPTNDIGHISALVHQSFQGLDSTTTVHIKSDYLLDYRAQRTQVKYDNGMLVEAIMPSIDLLNVHDIEGKPFFLLTGCEPDYRWEEFSEAVLDVAQTCGVKTLYFVGSLAAPVPHTRKPDMLVRSKNMEEVAPPIETTVWFQASFADYLEYRAGKRGFGTVALTMRVPMYIAGFRHAMGAVSALRMLSTVSGLSLPLGDLEELAREDTERINATLQEDEDMQELVSNMEKQYDAQRVEPGLVSPPDSQIIVPTTEEIGQAAEAFLARVEESQRREKSKSKEIHGFTSMYDAQGNPKRGRRAAE